MPIPKIDEKFPKKNPYTVFLKLELYIIKTHSLKFFLDYNTSWIYEHKVKQ